MNTTKQQTNNKALHGKETREDRPDFLERDLDGYVHTPHGFMTKTAYVAVVRANPGAGLPEWESLPYIAQILRDLEIERTSE